MIHHICLRVEAQSNLTPISSEDKRVKRLRPSILRACVEYVHKWMGFQAKEKGAQEEQGRENQMQNDKMCKMGDNVFRN